MIDFYQLFYQQLEEISLKNNVGYLIIPTQIFELFTNSKLSNAERKVYALVIRKTLGFQKEWDNISFTQFERLTGISRESVRIVTGRLVKRGLLGKKKGTPKRANSWKVLNIEKDVISSHAGLTSQELVDMQGRHTILNIQNNKKSDDLTPLNKSQLVKIASEINVSLSVVKSKHDTILDKIAAGEFKNRTIYFTLRQWLRGDIEKGYLKEMDETNRMAFEIQYKKYLK